MTQTILITVNICILIVSVILEFPSFIVYGNPIKNFKLHRSIIEEELKEGEFFHGIFMTNNGFLYRLPVPGIFGRYYFFHQDKGNIRIPWWTDIHKLSEEILNDRS